MSSEQPTDSLCFKYTQKNDITLPSNEINIIDI